MFKEPKRAADLGAINHAVFILLSDIDAIKAHYEDHDYKYRTSASTLDSLELLIKQYNLRYTSGAGSAGPVIPLENRRFLKTFTDIVRSNSERGSKGDVWRHGSSALKVGRVNTARALYQWKHEQEKYAAYDRRLAKWKYSDVSKAIQQMLDDELPDDTDSDAPDESNLVDPKVKRSAKRAFSEAISESDDDMPTKLKPKLGTSASIDTREESPLSQSSIEDPAPAEKPSMEDVPNMMEQMSKQLGDVSRALLEHFRLPHHLPSVFDPIVSQRDLQRLFKTCWGDDWPTVGKEIHNLFPESDLVQSLVSAYLQNVIFKPIGPRWNGYVSDIQSMLQDKPKPKGGRGKSFTQKISSILFRRTESTRNRLQTLIDESFAAALHNSNKRAELAAIFLENLTTTLTPMIQGLQKVAELYKPYEDFSKWREVLQRSLRMLLDTSLMVKWSTEATPDNTFDFIWSGYGGPIAPTLMKTRARSLRDSPAIVLTTLVPGPQVEYQESGRIQTQVLRPAEVLERIQSSMPSDASSSVAATDTSP